MPHDAVVPAQRYSGTVFPDDGEAISSRCNCRLVGGSREDGKIRSAVVKTRGFARTSRISCCCLELLPDTGRATRATVAAAQLAYVTGNVAGCGPHIRDVSRPQHWRT